MSMHRDRQEIEARLKLILKEREPKLQGRSFSVFYEGQSQPHLGGYIWEARRSGLKVVLTFWNELTSPGFDEQLGYAAKAVRDLSFNHAKSTSIIRTN